MTTIERLTDPIAEELGDLADVSCHAELSELIGLEAAQDSRRTLYSLMRQALDIEASTAEAERWLRTVMDIEIAKQARRATALRFLAEQIDRLGRELIPAGKKSVDVPGIGRLQYRKRAETVEFDDDEAFIAWAKEHELRDELVRVKEEVKRTDSRQYALGHFKETGELLPGVAEYVPEEELASSVIQWEAI